MFSKLWAPVVMSIALAASLGGGVAARSQIQHPQPLPGAVPNRLPPIDDDSNIDDAQAARRMLAKQVEKRNQDRQAQLVDDTNRLFDLAKELKDQVGKTNEDVLSVDVVKKAAEIEKLAKSVREKMKAN
jgi:hypothetical protein